MLERNGKETERNYSYRKKNQGQQIDIIANTILVAVIINNMTMRSTISNINGYSKELEN